MAFNIHETLYMGPEVIQETFGGYPGQLARLSRSRDLQMSQPNRKPLAIEVDASKMKPSSPSQGPAIFQMKTMPDFSYSDIPDGMLYQPAPNTKPNKSSDIMDFSFENADNDNSVDDFNSSMSRIDFIVSLRIHGYQSMRIEEIENILTLGNFDNDATIEEFIGGMKMVGQESQILPLIEIMNDMKLNETQEHEKIISDRISSSGSFGQKSEGSAKAKPKVKASLNKWTPITIADNADSNQGDYDWGSESFSSISKQTSTTSMNSSFESNPFSVSMSES